MKPPSGTGPVPPPDTVVRDTSVLVFHGNTNRDKEYSICGFHNKYSVRAIVSFLLSKRVFCVICLPKPVKNDDPSWKDIRQESINVSLHSRISPVAGKIFVSEN